MAPRPGKLRVEITFLEMTEPPAEGTRLPPPAKGVEIRRLTSPDVAFYRRLYNGVGERWLWYSRRQLSDDDLAAIIGDPSVDIDVLYADGRPAGFAEVSRRHRGEAELSFFGLMPDFIGRGFGPYLLSQAIHDAWAHGPRRLRVQTCDLDHPAALSLYKRMGFVPIRRVIQTWDDPRATGLIPTDVEARRPYVAPPGGG